MPTHTWWSLQCYWKPSASTRIAIHTLEFRGTPGGPTLCTGGTPGADSSDPPSVPANMFDADTATYWVRGANSTVRVWYQFPSPVSIAEVAMRLGGSGDTYPGSVYGPSMITLAGSDNGTNWIRYTTFDTRDIGDGETFVGQINTNHPLPVLSKTRLTGTVYGSSGVSYGPYILTGHLTNRFYANTYNRGNYKVEGDVGIDGSPVDFGRYRVRLYDKATGALIAETYSDETTGAYSFLNVPGAACYVLAEDNAPETYNLARADLVMPVPM